LDAPSGKERHRHPAKPAGCRSAADGEGEEGIDRSFERAGTPLHLGEQKPALERGEQSSGEVVWVDAGRELPVGM
jgi:hypothetical protein